MLTPKQEHFCRLIVEGKTQADAYRTAYPKSKKWKDETVWPAASRMMANSKIAARVAGLKSQFLERSFLTAERVLKEIAKLAFGDVRKLFGPGGELISISELDDNAAACVAGCDIVTVNRGEGEVEYVAKVKMADKLKALELAGKHLGLFRDGSSIEDQPMPTKIIVEVVNGRNNPELPS